MTPLKTARNAAASAMAWTLYHAPALERPYANAAHAARHMPGLHTLFRETTDRLAVRLVSGRREYRRVHIGPVAPILDVSSFTVKGLYFSHVPYEPATTDALLRLLEPGGVFVDIGANSGYFTVLAALCVGAEGRVLAFEPNPAVRRQLERHLAVNDVADRVTVSNVALADRDEDAVRFFVSCLPDNNGISSLMPPPETIARGGLRADATIAVPVRSFDTWSQSAGLHRIDMVKIDVEGAELQVLTGMSRTIVQVPPRRIICETPLESEAVTFLRARGYRSALLDEIPGGIPNLMFELSDR
jgi:FkbM family methyltransferase